PLLVVGTGDRPLDGGTSHGAGSARTGCASAVAVCAGATSAVPWTDGRHLATTQLISPRSRSAGRARNVGTGVPPAASRARSPAGRPSTAPPRRRARP